MKTNKKSQILTLSVLVLSLLLIFIYSIETENYYNIKNGGFYILNNIKYETCVVGKLSNGSYLDERFQNITIDFKNYCNNFGEICELNISKNSSAPTNLSLLNYTYYNYWINYSWNNYTYIGKFTC